ncbi:MAG: hemolysin family protein [Armatimonadota bacterium]
METLLANIAILVGLILANGIFAMSEFALVSARETLLTDWAEAGSSGARAALELMESPGKFLATIQIGITFVGIMAGAYGEATIARRLEPVISQFPLLSSRADIIAAGVVVITVTYFTLVIGELVPKDLGLAYGERIATIVSRPLKALAFITAPMVWILNHSTRAVVSIFYIDQTTNHTPVTRSEIDQMLDEWRDEGVLGADEEEMMEGLLQLSERKAGSVMTPRPQIVWLDVDATRKDLEDTLVDTPFSLVPVCEGSLDNPIGIARVRDIFGLLLHDEPLDLRELSHEPLFVPASMPAINLLQEFRRSERHMAIALDEHGEVEGLITPVDLMQTVVGDLMILSPDIEPGIQKLADGTFVADAMLPVERFVEEFDVQVPSSSRRSYHTLAGLVLNRLRRLPEEGDRIIIDDVCVEVVDMDGRRIDKLRLIREECEVPDDEQGDAPDDDAEPPAEE